MSHGVTVAVETLGFKIGELTGENDHLREHVGMLQAEVSRVNAENETLRAALNPEARADLHSTTPPG